ncbi:MAG: helix-turn-helix transcriptional regulator, partial [Planctomycetota bacterium]
VKKAVKRPAKNSAKKSVKKPVQRVIKEAAPAKPRLKLRDVQRVFRLIGEVRERGHDPSQWRAHMVRGNFKLLEADMVVSSEISFRQAKRRGRSTPPPVMHDAGWGIKRDEDAANGSAGEVWEIRDEREEYQPEDYHVLLGDAKTDPSVVSPDGKIRVRPSEPLRAGEHCIVSQCRLAHVDTVDQLVVWRFSGEPFTAGDARLIRLFHRELARLWKCDAMKEARDPTADLAPRLAQTLALLVEGDSEKQVAYKLGISPHTVHNYVKALHQRFDVCSRGELLAKANPPAGKDAAAFRPKLTGEVRPAGSSA